MYATIQIPVKIDTRRDKVIQNALKPLYELFKREQTVQSYRGKDILVLEIGVTNLAGYVGMSVVRTPTAMRKNCGRSGCYECDSPYNKAIRMKDCYGITRYAPLGGVIEQVQKVMRDAGK